MTLPWFSISAHHNNGSRCARLHCYCPKPPMNGVPRHTSSSNSQSLLADLRPVWMREEVRANCSQMATKWDRVKKNWALSREHHCNWPIRRSNGQYIQILWLLLSWCKSVHYSCIEDGIMLAVLTNSFRTGHCCMKATNLSHWSFRRLKICAVLRARSQFQLALNC